jgi:hypothetical protein
MNGHQGLRPTDVVGPQHSPRGQKAFSLEEAPCGSTGFFTDGVSFGSCLDILLGDDAIVKHIFYVSI